jgi:tyrosyl-tRNA synthetase
MYGKLMSIPDRIMPRYYDLLTGIQRDQRVGDPYGAKKALAHLLTAQFHGADIADATARDFATRFSAREIPADLNEEMIDLPHDGLGLLELPCSLGFASSRSEARRLVEQKAIKIDGERLADPAISSVRPERSS